MTVGQRPSVLRYHSREYKICMIENAEEVGRPYVDEKKAISPRLLLVVTEE